MTLIPLDDDIWTRLYGPYGTTNVAEMLRSLSQTWDDALANELFWENLHHQDTLYPVTHAAVPWICEIIAAEDPETRREAYIFLSHFVTCAVHPEYEQTSGAVENVKYNGLAVVVRVDAHEWIEADKRLLETDLLVLKQIETWLDQQIETIAVACARTALLTDETDSIYLLLGYAELKHGSRLCNVLQAWHDGHEKEAILEWFPPEWAPNEPDIAPEDESPSADLLKGAPEAGKVIAMPAEEIATELENLTVLIDSVLSQTESDAFKVKDAAPDRTKWTEALVRDLAGLLADLDLQEGIDVLKFVRLAPADLCDPQP